jgi:hypothetical protein
MEGFLYSPSLVRDLLLPWLDLISLWNLYQTSSFHLRTCQALKSADFGGAFSAQRHG